MKKVMKEMISTLLYILGVLCVTWFLIAFVVQRTDVEGTSMAPTLADKDVLFVEKVSYRFGDPERFDIVVFPYPQNPEKLYIKRIIGLPGETVQIDLEGNIYINGEILQESYGKEVIKAENIGRASQAITLGEDEYFVMGDNRNNSKDSRAESVGNIKKEDFIGRAFIRVWPFSEWEILD